LRELRIVGVVGVWCPHTKIDDGEGLAMRSGKEEGLLRPDRGVCRIIPALLFLAAICILPLRAA
jgi:hypothetical protein